jgi:hypothetical protein
MDLVNLSPFLQSLPGASLYLSAPSPADRAQAGGSDPQA